MSSAVLSFYCDGPLTPGESRPYLEPDIVPAVIHDLTADNCCLIIGPPGSGTSTALLAVEKRLYERNPVIHWWYIDLAQKPTTSVKELFETLAMEGAERFPDQSEAWLKLTKLEDSEESVENIFCRALIWSTRSLNQLVVLAIDHIEIAPRDIAKTVIRSVRSLYTSWDRGRSPHRMIAVVLAGSHRLRRQGMERGSPLNFARKHFISELTTAESINLLSQVSIGNDALFTQNASAYLAQVTAGDRYLLQRLGQSCLNAAKNHSDNAGVNKDLAINQTQTFITSGFQCDPQLKNLIPELIKDEEALYIVQSLLAYSDEGLDQYWLQREEMTAGIMRLLKVKEHQLQIRNDIYKSILVNNEKIISAAYKAHQIHNSKFQRQEKLLNLLSKADLASDSHEVMNDLIADITRFMEVEDGVSLMRYDAVSGSYKVEAAYPDKTKFHPEVPDKNGKLLKELQTRKTTSCLTPGNLCKKCALGKGNSCTWRSLDLKEGTEHLGTLIFRGKPYNNSYARERELADISFGLASALHTRQRRRGLRALSEVKIDQHSEDAVRQQLCVAIATLFNRPFVYLWDGGHKNTSLNLKASPLFSTAEKLSLDVEILLEMIQDSEKPFIKTYSSANDTVPNDLISQILAQQSLESLVFAIFEYGANRMGVLAIGCTKPWQLNSTERALVKLVVERVQTTLDNLCYINQAKRRDIASKRAAYLLSHELKSDPARIIREIEILLSGDQDKTIEQNREALEKISAWADDNQTIVERLLLYTWLETNSWRSHMQSQPLIPLVLEILSELDGEISVIGSSWSFENNSAPGEHVVDSYAIRLIFRNLIKNALQYAPKTQIRISAHSENRTTYVSISDQGPGVSPEYRATLFEAFDRGKFNDTRVGQSGNLGLGLYLVQQLMKSHGGQVTLDAAYQDGARFILIFPPHEGGTDNETPIVDD